MNEETRNNKCSKVTLGKKSINMTSRWIHLFPVLYLNIAFEKNRYAMPLNKQLKIKQEFIKKN